jgi:hypothetical protein
VVAEIARKIKRHFINDAMSFGSCSLHPYSFRWVTVALSYAPSGTEVNSIHVQEPDIP